MEYYYRTPRCPTSQIQKKTSSTSFAAHSGAISLHSLLCRTQSFLTKLHLNPLHVNAHLYTNCVCTSTSSCTTMKTSLQCAYSVSFTDLKCDISLHITTLYTVVQNCNNHSSEAIKKSVVASDTNLK